MNYNEVVKSRIENFTPTEIIVAKKLYIEEFYNYIPESTYYKIFQRMVKQNIIVRLSKGIYCIPLKTRFGTIKSNENQLIKYFTNNFNNGLVVGYHLFNREGITTQISKRTELYSDIIREESKTIANISIKRIKIELDEKKIKMIETLEILENYSKIEDINNKAFISYLEKASNLYDDEVATEVIDSMKYKKSTIAFLKEILSKFGVKNTLSRYLTSTFQFRIPKVEGFD